MRRWTALLAALLLIATLAPTAAAQEQVVDRRDPVTRRLLGGPGPDRGGIGALQVPQTPPGTFTPTPCFTELPPGTTPETVRCGYVSVPLNHDQPQGETIQLAVAVSEATGPTPAEDPLLVLGGGPGQYFVALFPLLLIPDSPLAAANVDRDVIFIDQRGVGFSQPALDCPEVVEVTDLGGFPEAAAACRDRLAAEGINLSAYDTQANVADLDLVRAALGYETWNVFGTSYGARLALQAARTFPDTVRSLVLSSPIPAERNFVEEAGPSFQGALDRLDQACAADQLCTQTVGDLSDAVDRVVTRPTTETVTADVTDPLTGRVVRVPVTAEIVANLLFTLFYAGPLIPQIPQLIAQADQGDYRPLLELAVLLSAPGQALSSQGQQLSFICAEEVASTSPEEVRAELDSLSVAARTFVETNPVLGLPVFGICADWDVEPADPITFEPVATDVPALIVTGTFDQITPPSYGQEVAAALPASVLVEVPDQGHSPLLNLSACGGQLLTAFLADPTSVLDTSCATSRMVMFVPAVPLARARATVAACPPGAVPRAGFNDVDPANVHQPEIECMAWWGVTNGVTDVRYQPTGVVTRGQMASFAARLLEEAGGSLPADPPDAFPDDDGSVHELRINQLAALDVVQGRVDGSFGPGDPVTRGQIATFFAGAFGARMGLQLPEPRADYFPDDAGSVHEQAINLVAEAGITAGRVGLTYDPGAPLMRDQLATFLARALDLVVVQGQATPPTG